MASLGFLRIAAAFKASAANNIQQSVRGMATKKQGGSSNNGRDSIGRRLGIKLYPGMHAKAGSIVIRQRGAKFRPDHIAKSTGMGKDHTVFATQPGVVKFTRHPTHKKKRYIVTIEAPGTDIRTAAPMANTPASSRTSLAA